MKWDLVNLVMVMMGLGSQPNEAKSQWQVQIYSYCKLCSKLLCKQQKIDHKLKAQFAFCESMKILK
jgi:hypothetical protein